MPRKSSSIIGVGNLLMGDDGLGIVALEQLRRQQLPPGIELIDAGCGGLTLLQLLADCERALLIDAADFGRPAGCILRLPAENIADIQGGTGQASLHQTGLAEVLGLAVKLGQLPELTLFLVQPQCVAPGLELSLPVRQALPRLLEMLQQELENWRNA